MEQLALRFRPRTFDDLVGQPSVQVILRQMLAASKVPHALLLDGPRGTGKTTTLRILAAALNCDSPPVPCGHCPSCKSVFDGTSLSLREIDAASHGLVDDIRALRRDVLYSTPGEYRIVGLDEAHSISPAGFNALLKVLEEPPIGTIWVLLTTEFGRIPDTIASRCMRFTFRRLAPAVIVERLAAIVAAQQLDVEPDLLALIAHRADGGMRDAVMVLDQVTRVGVRTAAQYAKLMGESDLAPGILTAILDGHTAALDAIDAAMAVTAEPAALVDDLLETLTDVLRLHSGASLARQGQALIDRQRLSERMSTGDAVTAMTVLWDLMTKVRAGDRGRHMLNLAAVILGEKIRPHREPATPQKLTLAQMAAIRR